MIAYWSMTFRVIDEVRSVVDVSGVRAWRRRAYMEWLTLPWAYCRNRGRSGLRGRGRRGMREGEILSKGEKQ